MKDFSKKIISTAAAIAVMASMSVFAEGNAVTESTASKCSHLNVTTTSTQSPITLSHHFYEKGKSCTIRSYTITYTITCTNCGAVVETLTKPIENHTSCPLKNGNK